MRIGILTFCAGLAGIGGMLAGCATIEARPTSAIPEIAAAPPAGAAEQASPPALESPPVENPAPNADAPETPAPLSATIEEAIVIALEHNQSLRVQEANPSISATSVAQQRAVFDPTFSAAYSMTWERVTRDQLIQTTLDWTNSGVGISPDITALTPVKTMAKTRMEEGSAGISQFFPTGTDVSMSIGPSRTKLRNHSSYPELTSGTDTDQKNTSIMVSVTQNLLQGAGLGVNLASMRQARLDAASSEYELRGFVEDLVAQVEKGYWDCVLAQKQIAIYEDALSVAQRQADEIEERIRIGREAETERAAAQAEVAQRRGSLIDARGAYDKARLALLRLLNPTEDALRTANIELKTTPVTPEIPLDAIDASVELAQRMRPDLNQARLQIQRDGLEIVKTKNGLLPQLDLFLSLGKDLNHTEYTDSFLSGSRTPRDNRMSTQVGVEFSYPIGNRAARALDERAHLARSQDWDALANMVQLAEQDVRTAYVELRRAKEQIAATAATRRLQEETLQIETEKLRLGRSPVLLVAQAQRDLLTAQINEVQAQTDYLKAIVDLYLYEGTLLERRGVSCPGSEPVELARQE